MLREKQVQVANGGVMLGAFFGAAVLIALLIAAFRQTPAAIVILVLLGIVNFICITGLFIVNPNEAKVLQLFGRYVGTVREPGWKWSNPFNTKRKVSTRIRNF